MSVSVWKHVADWIVWLWEHSPALKWYSFHVVIWQLSSLPSQSCSHAISCTARFTLCIGSSMYIIEAIFSHCGYVFWCLSFKRLLANSMRQLLVPCFLLFVCLLLLLLLLFVFGCLGRGGGGGGGRVCNPLRVCTRWTVRLNISPLSNLCFLV